MKNHLKEYFHYSKGERNGAIILLVLIVTLLAWYFIRNNWVETVENDHIQLRKEIDAFYTSKADSTTHQTSYFKFNPNSIGINEWQALGFSLKQATSIENYKQSGAIFHYKEDVKKLFVVDSIKYLALAPYIDLPSKPNVPQNKFEKNKFSDLKKETCIAIQLIESDKPIYDGFSNLENIHYRKKQNKYQYFQLGFEDKELANNSEAFERFETAKIVELEYCNQLYEIKINQNKPFAPLSPKTININLADTASLKTLKGIGSSYAKRIIKYRDLLGGFITIEQLSEVYGLPKETIEQNAEYLIFDQNALQQININTAKTKELSNHPYINWNTANSIVQIRTNHGLYLQVEDIKKSDLINDELFRKIAPYLTI